MEGFWDMKSDAQLDPENSEDPLDVAVRGLSDTTRHIDRLIGARYGSYLEIAYEWSWEEAMILLELIDLKEEVQDRADAIQDAQDRTNN